MRARFALTLAALVTVFAAGCEPTPPPLGSAPAVVPVAAVATDAPIPAAEWEYPTACLGQWGYDGAPLPITVEGGTGPRIAVIGDSLTTQAREILIARGGFDWRVSSYCGSRVLDWAAPLRAMSAACSDCRERPWWPAAFACCWSSGCS